MGGVVGGRWEVWWVGDGWCGMQRLLQRTVVPLPELEVGSVPPGVWRTTHRPQLILDLSPRGLHKEADKGNGESSPNTEKSCLVPVKLHTQQNHHYDDHSNGCHTE